MSKAIALSRQIAAERTEIIRVAVVYGCALALIAAGPVFPI